LRLGRHFRVTPGLKIVIGRNAEENRRLAGFASGERLFVEPEGFNGPSALICGGPTDDAVLEQAAALIARYTRDPAPQWRVRWREAGEWKSRALGITPESRVIA